MGRIEKEFSNFVGGINTTSANDSLADSEFPILKNIDLGERGSLKKRSGMLPFITPPVTGKGQGIFRYHKSNEEVDILLAINGKMYLKKSKIEDPTTAPTLSKRANANSTLPASTYYVIYTWKGLNGETLSSLESNITTASGEELVVTLPTFPFEVKEANIYMSTSTGTETLQGSTTTTEYVRSSDLVAGSALPTSNTTSEVKELTIESLNSFQTERNIESVQYDDILYIATGTKLIQFDGSTAKVVTPYTPKPLEALYIGTNGLADNPDNYLSDGTSTTLRIDGVTSSKRTGVINTSTTFTIYVSKPDTMSVEYKFQYREKGATSWTLGRDWGSKECTFNPEKTTEYELDFYAREVGTTVTGVRYLLPTYTVKATDENEIVDTSTIHSCNRILLHWDRIVLYGDTTQREAIYISHARKPSYIPTPNSLLFKNKEKEGLTSLVKYRDMLVAFTPNTIQALYGKSPDDFRRVTLNTSTGCFAPYTAKVIGNYIAFLAQDGVYILESVGYEEDKANVTKIDLKVKANIMTDDNAIAISHEGQYQLTFPSRKKRMRLYYDQGWVWVEDESEKLDFSYVVDWDNVIYGQSLTTGKVLKFDANTWNDDGFIYEDRIETKEYDFGEEYLKKKLKEIRLLCSLQETQVNLSVYIYADSYLVVDPDTSHTEVVNGETVWVEGSDPNVKIKAGTVLGSWVMGSDSFGAQESEAFYLRASGRCRKAKLIISHKEDTPNQILGFGFILSVTK